MSMRECKDVIFFDHVKIYAGITADNLANLANTFRPPGPHLHVNCSREQEEELVFDRANTNSATASAGKILRAAMRLIFSMREKKESSYKEQENSTKGGFFWRH